jgi:methyl-accepting chemotaxis protein
MDKVVQHTAANAEESAGASEEMEALAGRMKGFVAELIRLVSGGAGLARTAPGGPDAAAPRRPQPPASKSRDRGGLERGARRNAGTPPLTLSRTGNKTPEEVMPPGEGETFKNF